MGVGRPWKRITSTAAASSTGGRARLAAARLRRHEPRCLEEGGGRGVGRCKRQSGRTPGGAGGGHHWWPGGRRTRAREVVPYTWPRAPPQAGARPLTGCLSQSKLPFCYSADNGASSRQPQGPIARPWRDKILLGTEIFHVHLAGCPLAGETPMSAAHHPTSTRLSFP